MSSGKKIVTKIGYFIFERTKLISRNSDILQSGSNGIGSLCQQVSPSAKTKTKTNFEGKTLYRAPISVKMSDSRIFLGFFLSTLYGQSVISP